MATISRNILAQIQSLFGEYPHLGPDRVRSLIEDAKQEAPGDLVGYLSRRLAAEESAPVGSLDIAHLTDELAGPGNVGVVTDPEGLGLATPGKAYKLRETLAAEGGFDIGDAGDMRRTERGRDLKGGYRLEDNAKTIGTKRELAALNKQPLPPSLRVDPNTPLGRASRLENDNKDMIVREPGTAEIGDLVETEAPSGIESLLAPLPSSRRFAAIGKAAASAELPAGTAGLPASTRALALRPSSQLTASDLEDVVDADFTEVDPYEALNGARRRAAQYKAADAARGVGPSGEAIPAEAAAERLGLPAAASRAEASAAGRAVITPEIEAALGGATATGAAGAASKLSWISKWSPFLKTAGKAAGAFGTAMLIADLVQRVADHSVGLDNRQRVERFNDAILGGEEFANREPLLGQRYLATEVPGVENEARAANLQGGYDAAQGQALLGQLLKGKEAAIGAMSMARSPTPYETLLAMRSLTPSM